MHRDEQDLILERAASFEHHDCGLWVPIPETASPDHQLGLSSAQARKGKPTPSKLHPCLVCGKRMRKWNEGKYGSCNKTKDAAAVDEITQKSGVPENLEPLSVKPAAPEDAVPVEEAMAVAEFVPGMRCLSSHRWLGKSLSPSPRRHSQPLQHPMVSLPSWWTVLITGSSRQHPSGGEQQWQRLFLGRLLGSKETAVLASARVGVYAERGA